MSTAEEIQSGELVNRNRTLKEKSIIIIPIMLFVMFQSAFNQFGSILATLQQMFPDSSQTMIQMVLTTPSLVSIPVSLLSGILASFWPRKTIALTAVAFLFLGGLVPILLHTDIVYLFISSALIGVGQGLIISTSQAMISETFVDNDRDWALGLKAFAGYIGAILVALCVGFFALRAWYLSYCVYLFTAVIFILLLKLLPMGKPDVKLVSKSTGFEGLKFIKNPHYIYMFCVMVVGAWCAFVFYTNASMAVKENGGDVVVTSFVFAFNSGAAIVAGLTYGFIARIFKKYTMVVSFALLMVAFLTIGTGATVVQISIGSIIFGFSNALMQASTVNFTADTIPQKSLGIGVAISMVGTNVGITTQPLVINPIRDAFFAAGSASGAMIIAAIGFALIAAVEFCRELFIVKNSTIGIPTKKVQEMIEAKQAEATAKAE